MRQKLADWLMALVVFGVPLIFWITYTGPFQWIAEAQLATLGEYYDELTFLGTLLVWMLVVGGITWAVRRVIGRPTRMSEVFEDRDEVVRRTVTAIFASAPVVLLALGGYFQYVYTHTPAAPVHVPISTLIAGGSCLSRYVTIDDAESDGQFQHGITEKHSTTRYLPLLPTNYKPGDPVHAFAEIPDNKYSQFNSRSDTVFTGVVAFTGLPGMIRVAFERDRMPPASGYVLLIYDSKPDHIHDMAVMSFAGAGIIAAIGLVIVVKNWWQARRAKAAQPAPEPDPRYPPR